MPNFDTPEPISVTLELGVGNVRITASDRTDTVVEVRAERRVRRVRREGRAADPRRLRQRHAPVTAPKARVLRLLPQDQVGRRVHRTAHRFAACTARRRSADFRSTGRLGECRFKTSAGHFRLDRTGPLRLDTAAGHITRRRRRRATPRSPPAHGKVRIGEIDGTAVIKNSNGDTDDRHGHRRLRVRAANGDISVDRAGAGVDAKTVQRQHPRRRGGPRLGRARDRDGRPGDRYRRGHRRVARREHRVRARAATRWTTSRTGPTQSDETVEVRAQHLLRRHHHPPLLTRPRPSKGSHHDHRPSQPAIAATGLRKSFGDHVVLDGIDLTVPHGTVFSLLGANGAGKTTTVKILSTLIRADGGSARVAGHDLAAEPDAVRAAIGVTGQFSAVDNLLTGEENLRLMADLHHLGRRRRPAQRAAELLDQFDLVDAARKPASTYSGGMRRRLDLAMTLVGSPRVIFLDEPTTGLDPRSRRDHVADRPRPGRRRRHHLPHHPVPGGGRRARRPDRGARPRPAGRRGHRRRAQAPHPRRPRAPAVRRRRRGLDRGRRGAAGRGLRDDDALALQVPSDGSVALAAGPARPARRPAPSRSTRCPCTPPTSTTSSSPSPATPAIAEKGHRHR